MSRLRVNCRIGPTSHEHHRTGTRDAVSYRGALTVRRPTREVHHRGGVGAVWNRHKDALVPPTPRHPAVPGPADTRKCTAAWNRNRVGSGSTKSRRVCGKSAGCEEARELVRPLMRFAEQAPAGTVIPTSAAGFGHHPCVCKVTSHERMRGGHAGAGECVLFGAPNGPFPVALTRLRLRLRRAAAVS